MAEALVDAAQLAAGAFGFVTQMADLQRRDQDAEVLGKVARLADLDLAPRRGMAAHFINPRVEGLARREYDLVAFMLETVLRLPGPCPDHGLLGTEDQQPALIVHAAHQRHGEQAATAVPAFRQVALAFEMLSRPHAAVARAFPKQLKDGADVLSRRHEIDARHRIVVHERDTARAI